MKESTKSKLLEILEKELGRKPSPQEIANAKTDHNLLARLAVQIAEDASDAIVAVDASMDQKIQEKVDIRIDEKLPAAVAEQIDSISIKSPK